MDVDAQSSADRAVNTDVSLKAEPDAPLPSLAAPEASPRVAPQTASLPDADATADKRPEPRPEPEFLDGLASYGGTAATSNDAAAAAAAADPSTRPVEPLGYLVPGLSKLADELTVSQPTLLPTSHPDFFSTANHPYNRNGWRYTPAGTDKRLPHTLFRTLELPPHNVRFSWEDRSPFTRVDREARRITTDRGFRSARANVPVREGKWYCEVVVEEPAADVVGSSAGGVGSTSAGGGMADGPHVRVGWGRREASLNAPVGFDGYSYGLRDRTGDKVHLSRPVPYGRPFSVGDVVGMYVSLPPLDAFPASGRLDGSGENGMKEQVGEDDPRRIKRNRIPIRFKGQLYFESLEYAHSKEMSALMDRTKKSKPTGRGAGETGSLPPGAPGGSGHASSTTTTATTTTTTNASAGAAKVKGGSVGPPRKRTKLGPPEPAAPTLRPLRRLQGSHIAFFLNGQSQGVAFQDIFDFRPLPRLPPKGNRGHAGAESGSQADRALRSRENHHDDGAAGYYAFISVFGGAVARLNPGPDFVFPPPADIDDAIGVTDVDQGAPSPCSRRAPWRPLCELYDVFMAEQMALDFRDEEMAKRDAERREKEKEREKARQQERKKAAAATATATATTAPLPSASSAAGKQNKLAQAKKTLASSPAASDPKGKATPHPLEEEGMNAKPVKLEDAGEKVDDSPASGPSVQDGGQPLSTLTLPDIHHDQNEWLQGPLPNGAMDAGIDLSSLPPPGSSLSVSYANDGWFSVPRYESRQKE